MVLRRLDIVPCPGSEAGEGDSAGHEHTRGGPRPGTPWPGTLPMEQPSQAAYERLQADPGLAERDAAVVAEFEPAPWLLPPRTKALPYAGVHDLDALLKLRSVAIGSYSKTVTLLTLSERFAVMTQNTIYSMVKFAAVHNYIVGTWNASDLAACADLNLPCADITSFLPEPMDNGPNAGVFGTHDYLVVCWIRPAVVAYILEQGYAVLSTDSDIAYVVKPIWPSYLKYIEDAQADAAFQSEGPVNGGNYVFLPTPASIHFVKDEWAKSAVAAIKEGLHDQHYMSRLSGPKFGYCTNRDLCLGTRRTVAADPNRTDTYPVIRSYPPTFLRYFHDVCGLAMGTQLQVMDLCDWAVTYFHPICTDYNGKLVVFRHEGVWFMDDDNCGPRNGTESLVNVCQPLQWRVPATEVMLYSCPSYGLAFTHERPVAAAAAAVATAAPTATAAGQNQTAASQQRRRRQLLLPLA